MTSRQRLQRTLEHKPVDKLCFDLGAGGQTGMEVCAVHHLREALLGKSEHKVKISEPFQMLGEIDEELRKAVDADVVGVHPPCDMFDIRQIGWKSFTMPVTKLKKIIDSVATLELKDHNGQYETWNFPALGQGIVDIPGVLRFLKEQGHTGPLTIEIEGIRGIERDETEIKKDIADSVAYVRTLGRLK